MANNKRKYLVVAEVLRTGFITEYRNKYHDAIQLANELLLYGEIFKWSEGDKICTQLRNRGYKSYIIKGNQIYFENFVWSNTDGRFSVCILKVNPDKFCLHTFIRERENYSIVFESDVRWDKKRTEFFDKFTSLSQIAN